MLRVGQGAARPTIPRVPPAASARRESRRTSIKFCFRPARVVKALAHTRELNPRPSELKSDALPIELVCMLSQVRARGAENFYPSLNMSPRKSKKRFHNGRSVH